MSTITSLAGSDGVTTANSMTKINANFAALNADKIETSTLDTDTALTANSDAKIATQKAVRAFVEAGGQANASTTARGIVEEATQAEVDAGTAVGATGARLFINPSTASSGVSKSITAGATINGATLPVPVYQNKTDNEFYACDGNDTAALKFLGFAISNGTNGSSMNVKFSGIVSGFSGLDEGEKYYLSDTVGTIQNSPGTYEVLVGVAISTTELLIQKGKRYANGVFNTTSAGDNVITIGFRASVIRTVISSAAGIAGDVNWGGWTKFGSNKSIKIEASDSNTEASLLHDSEGQWTVSAVTDTTFTLNRSTSGGQNNDVYWEAEGEL